jgi:RimJ/RimL family protein N-acetyltransferase
MSVSLETERLLLRTPRAAEISELVPLINDFDVSKYLSRVPYPYTEDDAQTFMGRIEKGLQAGNDYVFAIRLKSGAFIGLTGIHPVDAWEFGYWIGKPYWGQGYATEAGRRAVRYAFEGLKADIVNAGWFHDNPRSGRVLAKLGFVPAGEAEMNCVSRGCTVNCHRVALDRATYMTRNMVS